MRRRVFLRSAVAAATVMSLPRRPLAAAVLRSSQPQLPDIDAVTGDGQQVTLRGRDIADLRARLRGRLLLARDQGYDDARRILNASFDKHPALIVQPSGVADIRAAVNFARENRGLLLAVKCGGHSFSGASTCDKGMMIDLSTFRAVRVDPRARRAWVTGGSLLSLVDHETAQFDLVTPLGTVSHTGVGGLVTGGGFGRVARRFGLAVDNLQSVDVVTADGQFVHASASENPDLFWGVRGGGGNFGIVTSFEFQLNPMSRQVHAGTIVYPISRARDAIALYGDYLRTAPDELDILPAMVQPPGGAAGIFSFGVCYCGPANGVDRALAPIRKLGTPLVDDVKPMEYEVLQRSGDIADPRAIATYLKSGFLSSMTPDLVSAIVSEFRGDPGRTTEVAFQSGLGAIGRVAPDATAFVQRDALANMLVVAVWNSADDGNAHIQASRQYWSKLEPYTAGFYVNDLTPDRTPAAVRDNYRTNHNRLVALKNRYDPKNLFRLNANIKPTAS